MLIVADVVDLVVEWKQEALWDRRAAIAFGHAVGSNSGKYADNPASSFLLVNKCDVSVIDGSVVHVDKWLVVVAVHVPVLKSNNVACF